MGAQSSRTLGDALSDAKGAAAWREWVRYAVYEEPGIFCSEFRKCDSEVYFLEGAEGFDARVEMRRAGARWQYHLVLERGEVETGEVVERVMRTIEDPLARVIVVTDAAQVAAAWQACLGEGVRAVTGAELAPLLQRSITRPGLR